MKLCGAGATISATSVPSVAIEQGSKKELEEITTDFVTISIEPAREDFIRKYGVGSVDYPATVTTCTDYPSFGRLQTGELARNNGICITNYPTNNVESDNDRPIIASGRGIETLRGQKVTLPGVPLEARAVGGGDYLANSGPMDIKILERENGVRIKSNNFDIKCGNNQTVKEEFSINVGSFSKADLEATLTYNKDKKSIAHKNKQLMPVTKSTKKMVDNAQSSSRMSAEDGEVVIEEHADYGVFAVSYKESVTQ